MKKVLSILLLGISLTCGAQLRQNQIIRLYDGTAPGYENIKVKEQDNVAATGHHVIFNVTEPNLEAFVPENPNGAAMLICPGGGFVSLSYTSEGTMLAERLAAEGITSFVLKYRLNPLKKAEKGLAGLQEELTELLAPFMAEGDDKPLVSDISHTLEYSHCGLEDGLQAMRILRSNAKEWGFDPDRIGVVGFSAGSMVTLYVGQNYAEDSRPAFLAPIYSGWHKPVKVPADSIPMFLCSPAKDIFTPAELIDNVYLPWLKAGYPVELHTYYHTVHGFGVIPTEKAVGTWVDRMLDFMKDCNFINR